MDEEMDEWMKTKFQNYIYKMRNLILDYKNLNLKCKY